MSNRLCPIVFAAALLAPSLAAAEPVPEAPRERHGLFGGGGLFGGNISCNGGSCGGFRAAGGISGHIGYLFGPNLGVLADFWAMTSSNNNTSISFVTTTIDLRYYVMPALWVQGGLGNGHAVISLGGLAARGDDVPVVEVGAGLELVKGPSWAIDVAVKLAQGSSTADNGTVTTGRSTGVGAHITWFSHR